MSANPPKGAKPSSADRRKGQRPRADRPKGAKAAAAQRAAAQAAAAKRRNMILGAILVGVIVVVAAVILLSSGGGDKGSGAAGGGPVAGVAETSEMLDGIPQAGGELGDPKAPVTLIEFADMQCPFCAQFAKGPYPVIVNDYVRDGKVRVEFRTLSFIGPDSEKAARAAAAAGAQGRESYFTQIWYFNQGEENTGYATDGFVERIWKAAGVDVAKAKAFIATPQAQQSLDGANRDAEKYGVNSTPSFVIGRTGGPYTKLETDVGSAEGLKAAIDALLKK
ncbi:MAG: thioredoxin domain-containing protein [Solirubrobacteraceae bacterium]|nr:thioredoxin domain-containing protein [Solirubrobacteraceae bacterium]